MWQRKVNKILAVTESIGSMEVLWKDYRYEESHAYNL